MCRFVRRRLYPFPSVQAKVFVLEQLVQTIEDVGVVVDLDQIEGG